MRTVLIVALAFAMSSCAYVREQSIEEMAKNNKKCLDAGLKSVTITADGRPIAITCAGQDYK